MKQTKLANRTGKQNIKALRAELLSGTRPPPPRTLGELEF